MHLDPCTNTHHTITDLLHHGMVKNTKLEYLRNGTYLF